ncbi:MAG: 1-deoxy-D-xylulose-5-phosphate reductoisomerase [Lentisphaerae bacterium]|nr:1-deoxy-D-xylulose-5-phosphate reductoisomerase [Lentisphaerota bacterium]
MKKTSEPRRRLVILGSTGSIGRQAMKVVERFPERLQVVGLCAGQQTARLAEQLQSCPAAWGQCQDNDGLRRLCGDKTRLLANEEELCAAVAAPEVDIVLCAIVGTAGLRPVLAAIKAGKTIALASKEILVMAGALVMQEAARSGSRILPVDSEHCAIFQCLEHQPRESLRRIILTASGGPFHNHPEIPLSTVTPEQALRHPTWSMGQKITLDSATLMNKGLEIIEAGWLFQVRPEQIQVLIHPQSIVHSLVEFTDHSILAQLAPPDMALPIQFCLNYPERLPGVCQEMDWSKLVTLEFRPPDNERFPALNLARQVLRQGGAAGAVFNAANEVAVERFLAGTLRFDAISLLVAAALKQVPASCADTLEDILQADAKARSFARQWQTA